MEGLMDIQKMLADIDDRVTLGHRQQYELDMFTKVESPDVSVVLLPVHLLS